VTPHIESGETSSLNSHSFAVLRSVVHGPHTRGTLRAMTSSSLERLLLLDGKLWVYIPVKLPQLSPVFRNIHEYREDFAALLVEEARESVKSGFEQSAGNDESIFSSIVTLIFDFSFWVSYESNCHQNISRC